MQKNQSLSRLHIAQMCRLEKLRAIGPGAYLMNRTKHIVQRWIQQCQTKHVQNRCNIRKKQFKPRFNALT
jgi:hypothetical protein